MSGMTAHETFIEMAAETGALTPETLEKLAVFNVESTENAEFFGNPYPWQEYEAKDNKDGINIIDDLIDERQRELDARNNATTPEERAANRRVIERIVLGLVETHKGRYADIKKALMDVDIEAVSDNYPFDDHFKEKYGGTK